MLSFAALTRSSSRTWHRRPCAGGSHGNVYRADKIDAALGNYFRVGNLGALRELALLWLADRVDEGLSTIGRPGHQGHMGGRQRIVVGLTGGPEGETLLRRGAVVAKAARRGATWWRCMSSAVTDPGNPTGRPRTAAATHGGTRRNVSHGRRRRCALLAVLSLPAR